jgi:predicted phosphodiesterase
MRIALFSDIHAIHAALVAVYNDARQLGAECYWCLGDVVGYGPQPVVALDKLTEILNSGRQKQFNLCLLGNHDAGLISDQLDGALRVNNSSIAELNLQKCAVHTLQTHRTMIMAENPDYLKWIGSLQPEKVPLDGIYLAHGFYAPDGRGRWLYGTSTEALIRNQFQNMINNATDPKTPFRMLVNGHYHVPYLSRYNLQQRTLTPMNIWQEDWITIADLGREPVVINPGSICLPRNETPSTYVLMDLADDLESVRLQFRRVAFDWTRLLKYDGRMQGGYECLDILRPQLMRCPLPGGITA